MKAFSHSTTVNAKKILFKKALSHFNCSQDSKRKVANFREKFHVGSLSIGHKSFVHKVLLILRKSESDFNSVLKKKNIQPTFKLEANFFFFFFFFFDLTKWSQSKSEPAKHHNNFQAIQYHPLFRITIVWCENGLKATNTITLRGTQASLGIAAHYTKSAAIIKRC